MSREENKSIIEVADMHELRLQQALKVVNIIFRMEFYCRLYSQSTSPTKTFK